MAQPSEKLQNAAQAVSTAVMVLRMEAPTFEAFLNEARAMENYGHVVDPTLYNNSERKAVNALMEPLFKAAVAFIASYDLHIAQAQAALKKASA